MPSCEGGGHYRAMLLKIAMTLREPACEGRKGGVNGAKSRQQPQALQLIKSMVISKPEQQVVEIEGDREGIHAFEDEKTGFTWRDHTPSSGRRTIRRHAALGKKRSHLRSTPRPGLDPASDEDAISRWGELAEFSGRANDAAAQIVTNSKA